MEQLSKRLTLLSESETIAMSQRSRELQSQGVDVINLSLGEPDFPTAQHVKEAAIEAINSNFTHYTPVPGIPDLRKAVSDKLLRDNELHYAPEQIIISNGGKQSLANVVLSLVDPGEEVIIPSPYWVSYPEMVKMAEGVSVVVKAGIDQDFKITPAQLEAAITPKTKLMFLNSPSNPTGSIYSFNELKGLVEALVRHPQVFVISDEIYEYINYEGKHYTIASFPEMKERVVVVNGVSKGYAMTGWRLGYIAAPLWIAKACSKLQGQYTSGVCSITQKASVAALNGSMKETLAMRDAFKRRRDLMVKLAAEIPGLVTSVPPGAFYLFPDVSSFFGKKFQGKEINNARDLSFYLLEVGHVATVSGSAFGNDNCLRLSYACADELLEEAMKRIKKALGDL
jgi:aspartate aminotransferase